MLKKRDRMQIRHKRLDVLALSLCSIVMLLHCSTMLALTPPAAKPALCKYHYHQESIEIDGHKVTTEYYVPDAPGTHPLVFMLHNSAGAFSLHSKDEPTQDNFGEKTVASGCFVVALPHYLEAFGIKSLTSEQKMISLFPQLLDVTNMMLSKDESLPSTRGKPVFLFGESLGGYLSVALALQRPEVMAVSEISGGFPAGYLLDRSTPLAMVISHGTIDQLIPESEAEKLKNFCVQHHFQYEMDTYAEVGHFLPQDIESICIEKTVGFFERQTTEYYKKMRIQ
jgi:dienelactone hydrolase